MEKASGEKPGVLKRWREKLKARNARARGIGQRAASARRGSGDHRARGGGDGGPIGGGF